MIPVPSTIKKYAKAAVAVVGFAALIAAQLASGSVDADVIITAGIGLLTTLGVVHVSNADVL